ncbi:response regulator transcription factor [Clostridium sp. M62/1]|uniref:response regulator transcription factor n=1 Tax=Clostridium sp. M62/1 TaxID=411486 RepID=UPI0001C34FC9|nr:response regulator transcription factor [Clostridium sp. M62/1]UEB78675.1 response regulator transcription factor [Clostridium sp. M62/1]
MEKQTGADAGHILIVEDDREIRQGIEIFLRGQGYRVFQAADGIEGLRVIEKEEIHLAIVDIMMPRMDGITMVIKLREQYDFPVIFLSAKSEEVDKIMGLNMGADDYVTKPFTPMELLARVNSQLRRYRRFMKLLEEKEAGGQEEQDKNVYRIGGLELNEDTVELFVDGSPVKVTPMEFKILLLLMKNPGHVFSAEEIYERVWNERAVNIDTVMVHVRNIREKIEINPRNPKYLKVVWGVGYKIEKQQ